MDTPSQAAARNAAYWHTWWKTMAFAGPFPYFKPPMGFIESLKVKCIQAGQDAVVAEFERARLVAQVHTAMPTLRTELRKVGK